MVDVGLTGRDVNDWIDGRPFVVICPIPGALPVSLDVSSGNPDLSLEEVVDILKITLAALAGGAVYPINNDGTLAPQVVNPVVLHGEFIPPNIMAVPDDASGLED